MTAHVGIGPRDPIGFGIAVKLEVSLPGIDRAVAQELYRHSASRYLSVLACHAWQRRRAD